MKRACDILCEIRLRLYPFLIRKKRCYQLFDPTIRFDKMFTPGEKTLLLSEKCVSEGKDRGTFL